MWASMPDAALLDAAGSGKLDTAQGIAEQARRLLSDPRAGQSVSSFFGQWLDLDRIGKVDKDATLFPKFTKDMRGLLRKETEVFTNDVVFGSGGLHAFLLGNYTFMNKDVAGFYGVTGPSADVRKGHRDPASESDPGGASRGERKGQPDSRR
jgi:hypothetical protein